jgi:SPP1 gp7 family putative phage head morphogenesis protein
MMALPAENIPLIHQVASQYDPTRTLTLRNAFARNMNKRFIKLRGLIRRAIIERDCFGMTKLPVERVRVHQLPGVRQFDFPRSGDKVAAFMEWLRQQIEEGILEVISIRQFGTAIEEAWTNLYINDSYERGVQRARYELIHAGYQVPPLEMTGGILASMSTPFHMDRVGLLFTRTFSDLRGITSAMDMQISRVLAQGMADGLGPRQIARNLTRTISGPVGDLGITDVLGRFIPAQRRAEMLARTETIRAHAEATLQEFSNWGVIGVTVKAEFRTATDYRVCPICASMHKKVYSLDEASGVIPVHPRCRCVWLPIEVSG